MPSKNINQICIASQVLDVRIGGKQKIIRGLGFEQVQIISIIDLYTIKKNFSAAHLQKIAAILHNPVSQTVNINSYPQLARFSWVIEIGFLPGVTDNVATTVKSLIEEATKTAFQNAEGVWTSQVIFLAGKLNADQAETIADAFANPLIQRIALKNVQQFQHDEGMDVIVPEIKLSAVSKIQSVNLDVSDDELIKIGKQGLANVDGSRRGPLALDLLYMKAIQKYFHDLGRQPTDIEIESIAQTWSEHCKHTIFANPIDELSDGLFKTYIQGATEKIHADICASVFTDNSGAIIFDDDYLVTDKVETHNSPSALDPFGGAITGIVGVNRDALGFGMGAKPILNRYGFCFAPPTDQTILYRDAAKTQPLLSAKRIMDGVIEGVNSGGNCSGIPTPQGFVYFDKRYRGKPLVFVGTVGLIPHLADKRAQAGDYIVVAGGRVGLDGIHGATFSSESLNSGSPATAVQIGDPITQKKLSDALIKEARDLNLYTSITDNGAGGLSCSVAEMAKESGGFEVEIEKVPLKYPGLSPWQIWISESQERMTLAVPPKKWPQFFKLMQNRGVEATAIGKFTKSGQCIVKHRGQKIMDLSMAFLHDGLPVRQLRTKYAPPKLLPANMSSLNKNIDWQKTTLQLLSQPSIASTSFISQQYDHEVQATSVLKPLQGRGRINADATVIRPLYSSNKGVVVSQALFPSLTELDPANMSTACIDAVIRQMVVVGASLEKIALLDNFCWCSANDPDRLGQLKLAVQAAHDAAIAYQTPFISGKDSMFNDFQGFDEHGKPIKISVPPTLLISALAVVDDVNKVVSLDAKAAGDLVYALGETEDELGGSEIWQMLTGKTEKITVPKVNITKNKNLYQKYSRCLQKGLIASAQSVGRGGLLTSLIKTSLGGQLGMSLSLAELPGQWQHVLAALCGENQGRIVVTLAANQQKEFLKIMKGSAVGLLGTVTATPRFILRDQKAKKIIDLSLAEMQKGYQSAFPENVGLQKPAATKLKKISQRQPKALVLTGYGINCEEETSTAFSMAGAQTTICHINDLIAQPNLLKQVEILAIPGGFSFGDDTGAGNAFAQKIKNSLWDEVTRFVAEDHLVIGICNGCQILANLGIFSAEIALLHNDSNIYSDRWVDVCVANDTPWLQKMVTLSLPIAHGEGKFFASATNLELLENNRQVAARYINGEICQHLNLPANPNGTAHDIAAITDTTGRVLGIMPHPERAMFFTQLPHWTYLKNLAERNGQKMPSTAAGLQVFQNGVAYFTGQTK